MAKAAKKAAKATAPAIKKGDRLKFKAYEDLPDDMEPIFAKGDILIVKKVEETDGDQVKVKAYKEADGPDSDLDTVFVPGEAETHAGKAAAPAKKAAKAAEPDEDDEELDDEGEEEADDEQDDETDADEESDEADDEEDDEEADEEEEAPKAKRSAKPAAKPAAKTKAAEKPAKEKATKAKKEKAAPARTKDEEAEEALTHAPSVKKILKKGDMLGAAKNLVERASQTYYDLGGVLAEIYVTKAYAEAGDGAYDGEGGWEEYLNTELGLEYRKAMDLIGIYKVFSKLEVDEGKLLQIGYTKMRLIARVAKGLTPEEIDALLDEAEEMGREELDEHIRESVVGETGKGKGSKAKKVTYKMVAFADEAEYIGAAIERAQEMVESGDVNDAMKHIFREWAIQADVDVSVDEAIKAVETRFGVELQVVGDEDEAEEETAPAPKAKAKAKPAAKAAAPVKVAKAPAKKAKAVEKAGSKRKAA